MTRIRRTALLAVGALLVTLAAACGGSSGGGSTGAGASGKPNTVTIKDFTFTPSSLTVKAGTKVTFVNEDAVPHNAKGSGSSSAISSADLQHGQSYTVTLTKRGTYHYTCTIHPNMMGTITVT
jgi:plastocyanin